MKALAVALALLLGGCVSQARPETTTVEKHDKKKPQKQKKKKKPKKVAAATRPVEGDVLRGHAVWYGSDWHGKSTASGERFNKRKLTAAHRTLPLGAKVRVTNVRNGKSVVVRINDRGPYGKDKRRIIDLSEAAARKLDFLDAGWTEVTIEVLELPGDE